MPTYTSDLSDQFSEPIANPTRPYGRGLESDERSIGAFGPNWHIPAENGLPALDRRPFDRGAVWTPDPFEGLIPQKGKQNVILSIEGDDGNTVDAQCTPTEFEDETQTEWSRFSAPGAGFQHMHFRNSHNKVVEFELYYHAQSPKEFDEANDARTILRSWCLPRDSEGYSTGTPKLTAVWRNEFSMYCFITSLRFRNLRFSSQGHVTRWIATIKLESIHKFEEAERWRNSAPLRLPKK